MSPRHNERMITLINMLNEGPPSELRFSLQGIDFIITEYKTGWDFDAAQSLIRQHDGFSDGIVVSGAIKELHVGNARAVNKKVVDLVRTAQKTRIYTGSELRDIFEKWTIQRLLKDWPKFFTGKKVLFHISVVSPVIEEISKAEAEIYGADPLILLGVPMRLKGKKKIEQFLHLNRPFINVLNSLRSRKKGPRTQARELMVRDKMRQWISQADVFVTYGSLVDQMGDFACLKNKIVVVDYLKPEARARLLEAGVSEIISFMPDHPVLAPISAHPLSLLSAVIDQKRILDDSSLSLDDYVCRWVEEFEITPNRVVQAQPHMKRCAFLIHALSQQDLWKIPALKPLSKAPKKLRNTIEKACSYFPVMHYGEIKGVMSSKTNEPVICDLYAIMATPKQLLAMNEEVVYSIIGKGIEKASKRGASIFGLGAYTKIVGDAGVTIAKRSPIPVTTGNSYSAATTLWAARMMVERLGFVEMSGKKGDNRLRAKAMVIGATGSIGRVSALLVSLVFDEVVLVSPRPDKLMEVRQEILAMSPGIKIRTLTDPNHETHDTDLIVCATSNQNGKILDINLVKPGAVICDCSRPVDVGPEEAALRPDVMVIESGEVNLPGENVSISVDIGLPKPSVYACLAETVLLTLEGRWESFSLSRDLSWKKVKEIYKMGIEHGVKLSAIQGPSGVITDDQVDRCRELAKKRLMNWTSATKQTTDGASLRVSKIKLVTPESAKDENASISS